MKKLTVNFLCRRAIYITLAVGLVVPLVAQVDTADLESDLIKQAQSILLEAREAAGSTENQALLEEILYAQSLAGDANAWLELDKLISEQMEGINAILEEDASAIGNLVEGIFGMAKAGQLRIVRLIVNKIENPAWKGYLLAFLSQGHFEKGGCSLAQGYLRQAIQLVESSANTEEQERALIGIARVQVDMGDMQGAKKTVENISNDEEKSIVFLEMVWKTLKENDIEGALQIAKEIQHNPSRAGAILNVAGKATDVDNSILARKLLKQVNQVVPGIPEGSKRNSILHSLAWEYARAGQVDAALDNANKIGDEKQRGFLLGEIVGELAEKGNYTASYQVLDSMQDNRYKQDALLNIAVALARKGDVDEALKVVGEIEKGLTREIAKTRIANARAWVGDIETAIRILRMGESAREISREAASLVFSLANQGDVKGAKRVAELVDREIDRPGILRVIANAQVEQGLVDDLQETLEQMQDGGQQKDFTLRDMAYLEAKAGRVHESLRWLNLVQDSATRTDALQELASIQAALGKWKIAYEWAKKERKGMDRGFALLGVGEGILQFLNGRSSELDGTQKSPGCSL